MKQVLLATATFFILVNATPQDLKRAYKQLEKSDYSRAKESFDKQYPSARNDAGINFGLMILAADTNSPYHNVVDAWSYALIVDENMNSLTPEEREVIAEYFANTEIRRSSWPVNKKMAQAIGTVEAQLIKYIREENNLDLAYQVIEKFPDYRYYQNVIHIRNQLEFRKYEKQNTLEGYLEFIRKFPDAAQIPKAIKYRDKLAYEKAKRINTVEAYETYMRNYSGANDYSTAMKMRNAAAFREAKQKNTIEALDNFIAKYPDALEIADAKQIQRQLLYEYAKKIQTLEAYDAFIHKYPEGSYYIDIFNLKSLDLGMKYFNRAGIALNNLQWSRSFDNNNWPESAGGIASAGNGLYVISGNTIQSDSLYEDAWVLKLDKDGHMIWNKILGGRYKDSVYRVAVNTLGDVLVLGYTYLSDDSASQETWIFELDKDGRKLWNRTLGKWIVTSLAVNSANEIVLGGYADLDSLGHRYSIMVINNSGKKLWNRIYTSPGEINDLKIDVQDNICVAGSGWLVKMNSKGYMLWDKQLDVSDSITCTTLLPDGSQMFAGLRDQNNMVLIKTTGNGNIAYIKELTNASMLTPQKMVCTADGKLIINTNSYSGNRLISMTQDGNQLGMLQIPDAVLQDFILDDQGNLLMQLTNNGNITVFKNSGTAF